MKYIIILFLCGILAGCQACSSCRADAPQHGEDPQDRQSAINSVAESVTQTKLHIKYCPVCGRRYSPSREVCPRDGATLKELTE